MTYPKDFTKECNIYNQSLFSDIKDYIIDEDSGGVFNLKYNDNTTSTGSVNTSAIKSIIDAHKPSGSIDNIWLPAIVSTATYVNNKEILFGNLLGNTTLGIEEVIKFENIKLKNWDITQGDVDLCVDWIINSAKSAYQVEYGVLCWYKLNTIHTKNAKYKIQDIPAGTRIRYPSTISYTVDTVTETIQYNTPLLKINNDFIKRLDKDSSSFIGHSSVGPTSEFTHYTSQMDIIPVSLLGLSDSKSFEIEDNTNKLYGDLENYDLWISNGEFYSYFFGGKDKYRRWQHTTTQRSTSRSYLSPSLYHIYRIIYNQITSKFIRDFGKTNNRTRVLEKLTKLCYILATAPLIDRVNINILSNDSLYTKIIDYINADIKTTKDTEIQELLNIVAEIFTVYKDQSQFLQKQTIATNYINNKKDLFINLTNKYMTYGKISSNTTMKFRSSIDAGAQGHISLGVQSFAPKTIATTADIYNDMKIQLGPLYVETQMNPNLSSSGCICKIGDNTPNSGVERYLPLANMALKNPEKLLTSYNKDYAIQYRAFPDDFDPVLDLTQPSDAGFSYSYSWSLLNGTDDCLRFTDPLTNSNRRDFYNKTSSTPDTQLYLGGTGLYTIRGTTSLGSSLKCIEDIDVYVYDGNNPYTNEVINYTSSESVAFYTVMCPNIRQIAFNKNGLIWFIDSDIFIVDSSYSLEIFNPSRLVDKQINIGKPDLTPLTGQVDLSIKFMPNNTIFKLNNIQIQHVIDNTDKHAQCLSFYKPTKARVRGVSSSIGALGGSRYAVLNRAPNIDAFIFYKKDNGEWVKDDQSLVEFPCPIVSTKNSPNVYSYGGYSQNVVQQLGVEIPYHPIKVASETKSFKKIPNGTIWNTTGTVLESGLLASDPAKLNIMPIHNNLGDPSNIRCLTTKIPTTGSITFNKGYFHPNSGWYDHDASYSGRTNFIQKFETNKYKSYELVGQGFFDLLPNNITGINSLAEYSNGIEIVSVSNIQSVAPLTNYDTVYGIRNWNGYSYTNQQLIDDLLILEDIFLDLYTVFICKYKPCRKYAISDKNFNNVPLTIQDLEIKVNYINMTNLKNIIIALEVYNPELDNILSNNTSSSGIFLPLPNTDRSSDPISWGSSDNKLLQFVKDHKITNSLTDKPNTRIVYLYNQESLDNYGYNFSLIFSENFDKSKTFTDHNKNASSGVVSYYNESVNHSESIAPCISPTGYSEHDCYKFREMIKNNRINVLDGSLSQFRNLPLMGTRFDLKIYVLGAPETMIAADNTMLNSQLSGLENFYIREVSNTITNSICNWSIIVHTDNTPKFTTTTNYLGSIDYDAKPDAPITGYNFIADMKDKEYLIPKVNLNAPYNYIVNNVCNYVDQIDLSKSLQYDPPAFPSLVPYYDVRNYDILFPQGTIGGRGDPIINFLTDLRMQRQSEFVEKNVFTPVYDGAYNGVGNKALIQVAGGSGLWYTIEVPIFKYKNTAILSQNRFKYAKLHKDMAVPFSNFPFQQIKRIDELVNIDDIKYSTTGNISLNGLSIENVNLKENDLVQVKQQTSASQNGIYYAKSSQWTLFPDWNKEHSLLRNNLWNNTSLSNTNITDKKVIAIPGNRAYNIFDVNDNISLMKTPAATGENIVGNSIQNKAILKVNNEDITIVVLNNPLSDGYESGFIGQKLEDSNIIMIYKDYATSGNNLPLSKWGLSKSYADIETINKTIVDTHSVAVGQGSVGYGSMRTNPTVYDHITSQYPNKILNTTDILNNNINDKFKYNNLTIKQYSDNIIKTIIFPTGQDANNYASDLLRAYPAGYNNTKYISNALNEYNIIQPSRYYALDNAEISVIGTGQFNDDQTRELTNILKNNLLQNKNDFYFIDLKSNKFKNEITSISGEIFIENDFLRRVPYKKLSQADRSSIETRLSDLQTKSDPAPTSIDLNTSRIPDLELFYSLLPPDPSGCFKKDFYSDAQRLTNCSGQIARDKLRALYQEKNELLYAIEIDNNSIPNVLPYFETELLASGVTLSVKHKSTSDSHYFINIDPEQYCRVAQESSPKILTRISFQCLPIVGDVVDRNCDPICFSSNGSFSGPDITSGVGAYNNARIEEEKIRYPNIVWEEGFEYTVDRIFFIACGLSTKETLVKVREFYLVPKDTVWGDSQWKVKDVIDLNNTNNISIKFKNVPRKIKTVDTYYTRYVPDFRGRLGKDGGVPEAGIIANDFMIWQCINTSGVFVDPPDLYKYMNEMAFRAFFGSADGVENKNRSTMISQSLWEWIPYEYF